MGALLQLVGIQRTPSQSLVKAPSADLIRADNELTLPEPYVPQCMDTEEFRAYKELFGDQFDNHSFIKQAVYQILVKLGIRLYPNEKVFELLKKQLGYYQKAVNEEAFEVEWRPTIGNCKYENPIPPRIIKLMKQLQRESESRYFQGNCDPYGRFIISDVSKQYAYRTFVKNKSLICFLAIELFVTSGASNNCYNSASYLIIDAWRGPTFSDEEACLPP